MDQKTTGIVAYLTWIGLLIALVMTKEKSEYTSFHMRQSLGLCLLSVLGIIPFLGYLIIILVFILWIIAFIGALNGEKKLVPIVGEYFQDWFKSV
jgi:uncharacterized membrane protein